MLRFGIMSRTTMTMMARISEVTTSCSATYNPLLTINTPASRFEGTQISFIRVTLNGHSSGVGCHKSNQVAGTNEALLRVRGQRRSGIAIGTRPSPHLPVGEIRDDALGRVAVVRKDLLEQERGGDQRGAEVAQTRHARRQVRQLDLGTNTNGSGREP